MKITKKKHSWTLNEKKVYIKYENFCKFLNARNFFQLRGQQQRQFALRIGGGTRVRIPYNL